VEQKSVNVAHKRAVGRKKKDRWAHAKPPPSVTQDCFLTL